MIAVKVLTLGGFFDELNCEPEFDDFLEIVQEFWPDIREEGDVWEEACARSLDRETVNWLHRLCQRLLRKIDGEEFWQWDREQARKVCADLLRLAKQKILEVA